MGERRRRSIVFDLASRLLRCLDCDVVEYVVETILWKRLSRVDVGISIGSIDVNLMCVGLSDMANRMVMIRNFEYDRLLG